MYAVHVKNCSKFHRISFFAYRFIYNVYIFNVNICTVLQIASNNEEKNIMRLRNDKNIFQSKQLIDE